MNAETRTSNPATNPPREAVTHELKVWPEYFGGLLDGSKTFEVRKNDRDYKVGDRLYLNEFSPCPSCFGDGCAECDGKKGEYTSGQVAKVITYVMPGGRFGLVQGNVVLGLADPEPDDFCKSLVTESFAVETGGE